MITPGKKKEKKKKKKKKHASTDLSYGKNTKFLIFSDRRLKSVQ